MLNVFPNATVSVLPEENPHAPPVTDAAAFAVTNPLASSPPANVVVAAVALTVQLPVMATVTSPFSVAPTDVLADAPAATFTPGANGDVVEIVSDPPVTLQLPPLPPTLLLTTHAAAFVDSVTPLATVTAPPARLHDVATLVALFTATVPPVCVSPPEKLVLPNAFAFSCVPLVTVTSAENVTKLPDVATTPADASVSVGPNAAIGDSVSCSAVDGPWLHVPVPATVAADATLHATDVLNVVPDAMFSVPPPPLSEQVPPVTDVAAFTFIVPALSDKPPPSVAAVVIVSVPPATATVTSEENAVVPPAFTLRAPPVSTVTAGPTVAAPLVPNVNVPPET